MRYSDISHQKKSADCVYYSGPLIAMFSRIGGQRELILPEKTEIIADVFSGEIVGEDTDVFVFDMPEHTPCTRIFFTGSRLEFLDFKSKLEN